MFSDEETEVILNKEIPKLAQRCSSCSDTSTVLDILVILDNNSSYFDLGREGEGDYSGNLNSIHIQEISFIPSPDTYNNALLNPFDEEKLNAPINKVKASMNDGDLFDSNTIRAEFRQLESLNSLSFFYAFSVPEAT